METATKHNFRRKKRTCRRFLTSIKKYILYSVPVCVLIGMLLFFCYKDSNISKEDDSSSSDNRSIIIEDENVQKLGEGDKDNEDPYHGDSIKKKGPKSVISSENLKQACILINDTLRKHVSISLYTVRDDIMKEEPSYSYELNTYEEYVDEFEDDLTEHLEPIDGFKETNRKIAQFFLMLRHSYKFLHLECVEEIFNGNISNDEKLKSNLYMKYMIGHVFVKNIFNKTEEYLFNKTLYPKIVDDNITNQKKTGVFMKKLIYELKKLMNKMFIISETDVGIFERESQEDKEKKVLLVDNLEYAKEFFELSFYIVYFYIFENVEEGKVTMKESFAAAIKRNYDQDNHYETPEKSIKFVEEKCNTIFARYHRGVDDEMREAIKIKNINCSFYLEDLLQITRI